MDLEDYLREDEPTLTTVDAGTRDLEGVRGTLAVTPTRIVFVADGRTTDVTLDDVTALRYDAPAFPLWNGIGGTVLFAFGILLLAVAWSGSGQPVTTILGGLLVVASVAIFALGAVGNRAATLEIYTPARSFEFESTDSERLAEVPGVIRGRGE